MWNDDDDRGYTDIGKALSKPLTELQIARQLPGLIAAWNGAFRITNGDAKDGSTSTAERSQVCATVRPRKSSSGTAPSRSASGAVMSP